MAFIGTSVVMPFIGRVWPGRNVSQLVCPPDTLKCLSSGAGCCVFVLEPINFFSRSADLRGPELRLVAIPTDEESEEDAFGYVFS